MLFGHLKHSLSLRLLIKCLDCETMCTPSNSQASPSTKQIISLICMSLSLLMSNFQYEA